MITQETAAKIWEAYREIAAGNKLLADIAKTQKENKREDRSFEPKLRDMFGRERELQLGVPSGENAHTLYRVHPDLAVSIIKAHIAEKAAVLVRLNEIARAELDLEVKPPDAQEA
jgi:hypothetical protein